MKRLWLLVALLLVGVVILIDIDLHTTLEIDPDIVMVVAFFLILLVGVL